MEIIERAEALFNNVRPRRALAGFGLLSLMACSSNPHSSTTPPSAPRSDSADAAPSQRFTTATGKVWTLRETKRSPSLSAVSISGEGFAHTRDGIDLGDGDPVEAAYLTDLDGNGFSELFIVRRSVGSGSYANLVGVASNSDLSFGPVSIPPPDPSDSRFAGYRGHDTLRPDGSCLMRSFPVYRDEDPNARASGGTREVCYRLEHGEASFALVPQGAQ